MRAYSREKYRIVTFGEAQKRLGVCMFAGNMPADQLCGNDVALLQQMAGAFKQYMFTLEVRM
jgi:hypothetical protein